MEFLGIQIIHSCFTYAMWNLSICYMYGKKERVINAHSCVTKINNIPTYLHEVHTHDIVHM